MFWKERRNDVERVRQFVNGLDPVCETADSLAAKLRLSRRACRRALDQLVQEGVLRRRDFDDIQPIFYRSSR